MSADWSWYQDGLRFRCTACGDCCTGAPGAVWVNDEEIALLAAHLCMDVASFEKEHVRRLGMGRSLYERFDGDCVFLDPDARRCRVYAARPLQCRTWPFWQDNVATPADWERTCAVCPGSGKGDLISVGQIRAKIEAVALARAQR